MRPKIVEETGTATRSTRLPSSFPIAGASAAQARNGTIVSVVWMLVADDASQPRCGVAMVTNECGCNPAIFRLASSESTPAA